MDTAWQKRPVCAAGMFFVAMPPSSRAVRTNLPMTRPCVLPDRSLALCSRMRLAASSGVRPNPAAVTVPLASSSSTATLMM